MEDPIAGSSESTGDYLLYGMMGVSLGYAGYDWYQGDEGVAAEVTLRRIRKWIRRCAKRQ